MKPQIATRSKGIFARAAIGLAVLGAVGLTAVAPARAYWDDWRYDRWRHHEWREHEWREHHQWRWGYYHYYHPSYYGYYYSPYDRSVYYGR